MTDIVHYKIPFWFLGDLANIFIVRKKLEEIFEASDGVMVARGDLGVEMPAEKVPVIQKYVIRRAADWRKPVIIATQMLESMIENPRPTRAEASDVASAVFEGADAVMLSAETATGKHPVEACAMMARIITQAEASRFYAPPPSATLMVFRVSSGFSRYQRLTVRPCATCRHGSMRRSRPAMSCRSSLKIGCGH